MEDLTNMATNVAPNMAPLIPIIGPNVATTMAPNMAPSIPIIGPNVPQQILPPPIPGNVNPITYPNESVKALKDLDFMLNTQIIPAITLLTTPSSFQSQTPSVMGNPGQITINNNGPTVLPLIEETQKGDVVPVADIVEPSSEIVEPSSDVVEPMTDIVEPTSDVVEPMTDIVEEPVVDIVEEPSSDNMEAYGDPIEKEEEEEEEEEKSPQTNDLRRYSDLRGGKKIGEGTYGCVHNPPLTCTDDADISDYNDKISKVMTLSEATKELAQYDAIAKMDPHNQYFLGVPELCKMADTLNNAEEQAQCKNTSGDTILLMKNGGVDLWKYVPTTPQFWVEFHRTVKGVRLFLENGYLHYDIKPDNIVYNKKENRVNFIDFGLMRKKRDIYDKGVRDGHSVSYHTTYSLEHFFYNKTNYDRVLLGSPQDKLRFIANFNGLVAGAEPIDPALLKAHKALVALFKWIGPDHKDINERILSDYADFVTLERDSGSDAYFAFIVTALNKFDIYGLGLTIIWLLNRSAKSGQFTQAFFDDMYELAYNMITPNIYKRYDIEKVDAVYVKIMMDHFFKEVPNIKAILKKHTPFTELQKGGRGGRGGHRKSGHNRRLMVDDDAVINIPRLVLRKKPHNFLQNVDIKLHSKISKIRSNQYRFLKNKKRTKRTK